MFRANPAGGTGALTFEIARKRYPRQRRERQRAAQRPAPAPRRHGRARVPARRGARRRAGARLPRRDRTARARASERLQRPAGASRRVRPSCARRPRSRLSRRSRADGPRLGGAARAPAGRAHPAQAEPLPPPPRSWSGLAAIWVIAAPALSERSVEAAYRQGSDGDLVAAAASARRAQRLNPLSAEALSARATVAGLAGDDRAAETFNEQATRLQPENPATWYRLGVFRYVGRRSLRGLRRVQRRVHARPEEQPLHEGGPFDRAKAAVNDRDHPACGR